MTRAIFESELQELHAAIVQMGLRVSEALENAVTALKQSDLALAKQTMEQDRAINEAEKMIESRCLSLMLRQQPVARDLREVSGALKLVSDLERLGDHAADISETLLHMGEENWCEAADHIPELADAALSMVTAALCAFREKDADAARKIGASDDRVDALFQRVKEEIIASIQRDDDQVDRYLDWLMIAKYFERIGDHAENICEWVEFTTTGDYKDSRIL